jgi:hypothetical protein
MKDVFTKAMSASVGVAVVYAALQVVSFAIDQKSTEKIRAVIAATAPVVESAPSN